MASSEITPTFRSAVHASWFFGGLLFSVTRLYNVAEWTLGMFGDYGFTGASTLLELQTWSYIALLPILIVGATPVFPWVRKRIQAWAAGESGKGIMAAPEKGNDFVPPCEIILPEGIAPARARTCVAINVLSDIALFVFLILSCMPIVSGGYNPFIYFQF